MVSHRRHGRLRSRGPKTMKRIVSAEVNTVLIFSPWLKLFDFIIFLGLLGIRTATLSAWAAPAWYCKADPALATIAADARSLHYILANHQTLRWLVADVF